VLSARGDRPSAKARALEPARTYPDGSGAREAPKTEKDPSKVMPGAGGTMRSGSGERLRPKLPLIITVAMVVLAVAIAGLVLGGVLKL
jgi:hypothetical protein